MATRTVLLSRFRWLLPNSVVSVVASVSALLLCAPVFVVGQDAASFTGCAKDVYYQPLFDLRSDVRSWDKLDIGRLLKDTQRRVLPYTSSSREDVWDALIDLDGDGETVQLIYKQTRVPADDYGTGTTWNREHLWPKSHGVGNNGADFTDVHHLRPADWNVNSARSNLYFGACSRGNDDCDVPAHPEAAVGTEKDSVVFLPPPSVRGDIARAVFYMDVRYFGDGIDIDLELTDCPVQDDNHMAYLSQLLEWHYADPVDDVERQRNSRVCERWQGNRNIFVDYPQIVEFMYGKPQQRVPDSNSRVTQSNYYGYPQCRPDVVPFDPNAPTDSPADDGEIANKTCADLQPGDVQIVAVYADDPDLVAMVALETLPANVDLVITDNAWTGKGFRSNEGTIEMTIPPGGISKGTVFGYAQDESVSPLTLQYRSDWTTRSGTFALSAKGDTVFVYCLINPATAEPLVSDWNMLGGFSFAGESFLESNLGADAYGTDNSALPDSLKDIGGGAGPAAPALPHRDNYVYVGPRAGTKLEVQKALRDADNWEGSNQRDVSFDASPFEIDDPAGPELSGSTDPSSSSRTERSSLRVVVQMVFVSLSMSIMQTYTCEL